MAVDLSTTRRREPEPPSEAKGPAAYVAEFVGTFLLVLTILVVLIENSRDGLGFTDWAVIGLVHAFVLLLLVQSLGGTSGAHFNPAVSVTLAALRKISPVDAGIYIVLQLAGAVAAALVAKALLTDEGDFINYGSTAVSPQTTDFGGFIAELIGTFLLMWAIMSAAVNPRAARSWAPLVIGIALGLAVFVFGPLSGAGVNPARAFGPEIVAGEFFDELGTWLFVYLLGPLLGALLAGTAYTGLVLQPQARELGLEDVAVTPEGDLEVGRDAGLESPGERPVDKLE
jgi:glycerol uptake facilitator protein